MHAQFRYCHKLRILLCCPHKICIVILRIYILYYTNTVYFCYKLFSHLCNYFCSLKDKYIQLNCNFSSLLAHHVKTCHYTFSYLYYFQLFGRFNLSHLMQLLLFKMFLDMRLELQYHTSMTGFCPLEQTRYNLQYIKDKGISEF